MIGKTVSHYKILEKIGEGAMGEVYLALDTELDRNVALKFISAQYNSDLEFKTRFKREARAAAALNHPNIVTIYNFGEFEDRSYIVMEYLEGGTLKELVAANRLKVHEAVDLIKQIGAGLSKAHEDGMVHRDIKPANILFNRSGLVKIADFGLALLQDGTIITRTGIAMGTPVYMSPEQARGDKLDLRSDIFSVGVVFYELLTGQLPFKGDNLMAVIHAISTLEPPPLQTYRPGISPALQKIIDKALAKDLRYRYRKIEGLLDDLKRIDIESKEIEVEATKFVKKIDFMIGKTISHYQILEKIGEGAMGEVYLAQDTELRRKTALKFISSQYNSDPEFKTRFKREAQAAAALNHPNIITIHAFGEFEDRSYIVMEYLEGGTLKELISANGLKVNEAVDLILQIGSGLSKAHEAGTVHRDIKPANILLNQNGQVKIVDFGLALLQGGTGITRTGTTMGTPNYMSPEQARGDKLDLRSDIFSAGVVLYELLTGHLPFQGDNLMVVLYAIVNLEPLPLKTYRPEISPGWQKIIDKALSKNITGRYRRMDDFMADIKKESDRPVSPEPPTTTIGVGGEPPRPLKPVAQRPLWQIGTATAFALALLWGAMQFGDKFLPKPRNGPVPTATAVLAISSAPSGAAVFLNGDSVGITPANYSTALQGRVAIRLRKPDYFDLDTSVALGQGQATKFSFPLRPAARIALSVNPSNAQVSVDGEAIAPSRRTALQLAPGWHDVALSAPGYQTRQDRLNLLQGKNPSRNYTLEIATETEPPPASKPTSVGAVSIVSEPPGAEVTLNDKAVGKTPYENKNVVPGDYQVLLRFGEEYESFSTSIIVRAGSFTPVRATLAARGVLDLASDPEGAVILIDGESFGSTRKKVQLRTGTHAIVLRKQGYKDYLTSAKVDKGEVTEVSGKLEPLLGKLSVIVKPYGTIYIDDRLEKRDANVRYAKDLPSGSHRLRVMHPSLGTWEKTVSVEPDKENQIQVDFNQQVKLTITSFDDSGNPIWANIFVDDKNMNQNTPKQLTLAIGLHKIEVRRDGYQIVDGPKTVLLEANWDEPMRFTLRKNQ